MYAVREIFHSLQGEGAQSGRAAVFCRFAGCNLWSGRERDRARAACTFCDTDFVGTDGPGGGRFASAASLAAAVDGVWQGGDAGKFVVCTGGEPLLQMDLAVISALHGLGFEVAVETNGTLEAPAGLDWICVSPKAGEPLAQTCGDELKLVFPQPQPEAQPARFRHLAFRHFFLQPMAGPALAQNTAAAAAYCQRHPPWRLSLQTHKIARIP